MIKGMGVPSSFRKTSCRYSHFLIEILDAIPRLQPVFDSGDFARV